MNRTIKMAKLNLTFMKQYIRTYILIIAAYLLIFTVLYKTVSIGIAIAIMYGVITIGNIFSIEEKNGLNKLYGILPISKKDVINGKYLYFALKGIVMGLISTIVSIIILSIMKVPFLIEEVIGSLSIMILLYSFFVSIQVPIYIKKGFEKGKAITYIPIIIVFALSLILGFIANMEGVKAAISTIDLNMIFSPTIATIGCILIAAIFYTISYYISKKIYLNKDI